MRKEARLLLTLAPSLGLRRRSLSGAAETQDEGQTSKTVRPSFSPLPSVRNFPRCFKISSFCPLNSAPKRAIHIGCKSAKAGHAQTVVTGRGKGNPYEGPCPPRSKLHPELLHSFVPILSFRPAFLISSRSGRKCDQNAYKMHTKTHMSFL